MGGAAEGRGAASGTGGAARGRGAGGAAHHDLRAELARVDVGGDGGEAAEEGAEGRSENSCVLTPEMSLLMQSCRPGPQKVCCLFFAPKSK